MVAAAWLNTVDVDGVSYPYTLSMERRSTAKSGDAGFHQREATQGTLNLRAYEFTVFINEVPVTAFLEEGSPSIRMTYNSVALAHQLEVLIAVLDAIEPLVTDNAISGTERVFNAPNDDTMYTFN